MRIIAHIPNSLTCLNLLCGYIGIIAALEGNLTTSSSMIFLAAFFDFFDGFAARLLKAHSKIGKDLDSLADVVTFGILPGIIVYKLSLNALQRTNFEIVWLSYLSAIIPIFSALRLAKFNVDTRQTNSFLGLPTPANALFVASLPYICSKSYFVHSTHLFTSIFPLMSGVIMSCLLISEVPLMALKFRDFTWYQNKIKYTLVGLSILIYIFLGTSGIPAIVFFYIVLSLIENKLDKNRSGFSEKLQ